MHKGDIRSSPYEAPQIDHAEQDIIRSITKPMQLVANAFVISGHGFGLAKAVAGNRNLRNRQ